MKEKEGRRLEKKGGGWKISMAVNKDDLKRCAKEERTRSSR